MRRKPEALRFDVCRLRENPKTRARPPPGAPSPQGTFSSLDSLCSEGTVSVTCWATADIRLLFDRRKKRSSMRGSGPIRRRSRRSVGMSISRVLIDWESRGKRRMPRPYSISGSSSPGRSAMLPRSGGMVARRGSASQACRRNPPSRRRNWWKKAAVSSTTIAAMGTRARSTRAKATRASTGRSTAAASTPRSGLPDTCASGMRANPSHRWVGPRESRTSLRCTEAGGAPGALSHEGPAVMESIRDPVLRVRGGYEHAPWRLARTRVGHGRRG